MSNDVLLMKQGLLQLRQYVVNEMFIYKYLIKSKFSINKITLFSFQHPKLGKVISKISNYFL